MRLGHWQNFQKLYIYSLSQLVERGLISLYGQPRPRNRPIFKSAMFGYGDYTLAKDPEVAHILSFYPRGSTWSSFSLGQWFSTEDTSILTLIYLARLINWYHCKISRILVLLALYHPVKFESTSTNRS